MFFRKGQIQMFLLVGIVIVLAISSIFIHLSIKENIQTKSEETNSIIQQINFNEEYVINKAEKIAGQTMDECRYCSPEDAKAKFIEISKETEKLFRYEGAGNFYAKIRNNDFELEQRGNLKRIRIRDLFVESKAEQNQIRREFEICLDMNPYESTVKKC